MSYFKPGVDCFDDRYFTLDLLLWAHVAGKTISVPWRPSALKLYSWAAYVGDIVSPASLVKINHNVNGM